MFSPATRKSRFTAPRDRTPGYGNRDSPSTPVADARGSASAAAIPNRPVTGTPAPWAAPRLSVIARIPSVKNAEKGADVDQIQPVYVGEVPQVVRRVQADYLQNKVTGDAGFSGGMDKGTSLSWIICENQLFIWSYLSPSLSKQCVSVDLPSSVLAFGDITTKSNYHNHWMVCFINWNTTSANTDKGANQCSSSGVIICHRKTKALVYWSDIFSESGRVPVVWLPSAEESQDCQLLGHDNIPANGNQELSWTESGYFSERSPFNSMIASAIPGLSHESFALVCHSNGDLSCFHCSPIKIFQKKVSQGMDDFSRSSSVNPQTCKVYAKTLIWRFQCLGSDVSSRQFFLLIDHQIQCWSIILSPDSKVTKLWSHEIVGTDGELGIKKDLAGQKHIWLLDMQVDDRGKEFTILVATFCKDRASSSSYIQYSLLTMQYKPEQNVSVEDYKAERVLEKKAPLQVIIPKARVEDESALHSMRLRVGGKPSGSAIILSGDGTATITSYWRGSTRLYKFDLPYDAGQVLDASIFPSSVDGEEGAWVVLTEKAGVWAIPEKAVLLGGVKPPERSLSRKGSSKEGVAEEEKRSLAFGSVLAPRRASSEAWNAGDRQRTGLASVAQRTAQDEEAEILLGRLFHDFILSGEVEGVFEKLKRSGAFEKVGEMNVFARMSKSIVDTLAKHWTTTRGAEFVASAVVVSQLLDKKQKHERFLQFLALSKCHEELSLKQRYSLQIIVEHGEKLFGMIQVRELQNLLSQNRANESEPPHSFNEAAGSLWDLIQLVGEKARRNAVLLMDRDNAEVFYSKVSDIEELFNCLSLHMQYLIGEDQHVMIQIRRAYELSNVCITLIHATMHYRNEHQTWYPPPEGLTPWNCQPVVCSGLWSIASAIIHLLKEAPVIHMSVKSGLYSQLEGLTDVLLEAYTSSITAKIERDEEHKGLAEEYHKRRDALLDSLYQQVQGFTDVRYKETCQDTEDTKLKESIFREVSSHLLSIAKRHEGYQTLWNICYDLHDTGLLRSLMHESLGPKGGFSYFVFKQLHGKRQYSKLLRLGEEFQDELTTYLKQHSDLLWLHEVFLNHFSSASNTLHALANSFDEKDSTLMIEENSGLDHTKGQLSLADRRHLLNLSKIAAMAGKDEGFETKIRDVEADLHILKLQEEILKQFPDREMQVSNKLLSPGELIEICLKGKTRELSLLAFEVFSWTSSSNRISNKCLLEECWMNAADQDDWLALHQSSVNKGWSDEVSVQSLRETILFKASNMCYGPEAESYGGGFEELLPLQKEDGEFPTSRGLGASVEGILMQHKDFPDAGKLMLTAIVIGKMGSEVEEDLDMELQ